MLRSKGLGEVLTLSACLLFLVRWPGATAHRVNPMKPDPWSVSCSEENEPPGTIPPGVLVDVDVELLEKILVAAADAKNYIDAYKSKFVEKYFGEKNFEKFNRFWSDTRYDWAPIASQKTYKSTLGSPVNPSYKNRVYYDEFLLTAYKSLQVNMVGLEQAEWDERWDNGYTEFEQYMAKSLDLAHSLLCKLELALLDRDPLYPRTIVVRREVMPEELSTYDDATRRNFRNWMFLRDYMYELEFVIEMADYFIVHPSRLPAAR